MTRLLATLFAVIFSILFLLSVGMAVYAIITFELILLVISWFSMSVTLWFYLDAMYELKGI